MRPGLAVAAAAVLLGATAAGGAANAADEISIDHVETNNGTVSMILGVDQVPAGVTLELDSVEVTVDGERVDAIAQSVEDGPVERTTVRAGSPMNE